MCKHGHAGVNLCSMYVQCQRRASHSPGAESQVALSWQVEGSFSRATSAISQGHNPGTRDQAFCSCHLETLNFLRSWGEGMCVHVCSCILRGICVRVSWLHHLLHLPFPVDYYCLLHPARAEFRKGCDRVNMSHVIWNLGIMIIPLYAHSTSLL